MAGEFVLEGIVSKADIQLQTFDKARAEEVSKESALASEHAASALNRAEANEREADRKLYEAEERLSPWNPGVEAQIRVAGKLKRFRGTPYVLAEDFHPHAVELAKRSTEH